MFLASDELKLVEQHFSLALTAGWRSSAGLGFLLLLVPRTTPEIIKLLISPFILSAFRFSLRFHYLILIFFLEVFFGICSVVARNMWRISSFCTPVICCSVINNTCAPTTHTPPPFRLEVISTCQSSHGETAH